MKNMEAIKFHEANITKKEIKNVLNILDSGWLTTGPAVKKFETNFLKLFKKNYIALLSIHVHQVFSLL